MADKYYEDPLESLLDEQSDEEFGLPEVHNKYDHGARENQHGNLKTWTAEEFSSIYVRFYPHLVRHAKRYLSNEVQAEEVVQDAFLYMMTALPEIDTELGVLKFMKWKVRLLALDVIRATPNQRETLVDSFDDELSAEVTDSEIERADDIAVIRAALAKLNPRHREALVAIVYEEKTSVEVAAQMGLSDNAARQLVFRARAAFKKALVGEAEVAGKSVSEILSIAAKRAAQAAKEGSKALSILAIIGISAVLVANSALMQRPNQTDIALENVRVNDPITQESDTGKSGPVGDGAVQAESSQGAGLGDVENSGEPVPEESFTQESAVEDQLDSQNPAASGESSLVSAAAQEENSQPEFDASITEDPAPALSGGEFTSVNLAAMGRVSTQISSALELAGEVSRVDRENYPLTVSSISDGLSATVWLNLNRVEVNSVSLTLVEDGRQYVGYPRFTSQALSRNTRTEGQFLNISSSDFYFVDAADNVLRSNDLKGRFMNVTVSLDQSASVQGATVTITD